MRRLAGLALVVLVTLALGAETVRAHATLLTADPPPNSFARVSPRELTLRFSEPIEPRLTGARVIDQAGVEVPAAGEPTFPDDATLRVPLPDLAPGFYAVTWTNVSRVDGHGASGSYPFTVLRPDGSVPDGSPVTGLGGGADTAPEPVAVVVRWLLLLGLSTMAGAGLLVLVGRAAPLPVRTAMLVGGMLAAAGSVLALALLLDEYRGLDASSVLFDTDPGRHGVVRVLVCVIGMGGAGVAFRSARWEDAFVPLAAAVGGVFTLAGTSHAAAGDGYLWGWLIDWLHGTAAVAWIGGVVAVALAARTASTGRGLDPVVLRRFALVASASVFTILATGLLESLMHVRSVSQLTGTTYGGWLLVKLVLLLPLLGIALYNARRASPAAASPRGAAALSRLAGIEALVGAVVFAVAAVLTQVTTAASLPPETRAASSRFESVIDDVAVILQVEPNRTGFNTFDVTTVGLPPGDAATGVRLTFRYLDDASVGPSTLELTPSPTGGFGGAGPYLPLEGNWEVEAFLRFGEHDDVRARIPVRPAGSPFVVTDVRGAWHNPAASLLANQFGGIAIVLAGLGLFLLARRTGGSARLPGSAFHFAGIAVLVAGGTLLFGVHVDEDPAGIPTNPIPADRDSVETGARLYAASCAACHGAEGVPPQGLDLNPYPLDLNVHVPLHSDGVLYRFVSAGVPGTAMRAWGEGEERLSDEEIWHLVNFLRTFRLAEE